MKNYKRTAMALSSLIVLLCAGCSTKKEEHRVLDNSTERGVRIEVLLKGGGSAVLVCPKFNSEPLGAHGRECYLDSYDKKGT